MGHQTDGSGLVPADRVIRCDCGLAALLDGFGIAVEGSVHHLAWCYVVKIPRTDRVLGRLKQRVFADALGAAEHQSVIELLLWPLHPMRQPIDDVTGVVRINSADMSEPRVRLASVA